MSEYPVFAEAVALTLATVFVVALLSDKDKERSKKQVIERKEELQAPPPMKSTHPDSFMPQFKQYAEMGTYDEEIGIGTTTTLLHTDEYHDRNRTSAHNAAFNTGVHSITAVDREAFVNRARQLTPGTAAHNLYHAASNARVGEMPIDAM